MRRLVPALAAICLVLPAVALAAPAKPAPKPAPAPAAAAKPPAAPSAADKAAIFKAAGFKLRGKDYVRCEEDTAPSYMPGAVEMTDLNGDGKPEAIVTEGSGYCYGETGEAGVVLKQDAAGAWTKVLDETGVLDIRATKHNGWKDILVGGPGMGKMPVYFYNGTKYAQGGMIQP